jgi:hypothetical protein
LCWAQFCLVFLSCTSANLRGSERVPDAPRDIRFSARKCILPSRHVRGPAGQMAHLALLASHRGAAIATRRSSTILAALGDLCTLPGGLRGRAHRDIAGR